MDRISPNPLSPIAGPDAAIRFAQQVLEPTPPPRAAIAVDPQMPQREHPPQAGETAPQQRLPVRTLAAVTTIAAGLGTTAGGLAAMGRNGTGLGVGFMAGGVAMAAAGTLMAQAATRPTGDAQAAAAGAVRQRVMVTLQAAREAAEDAQYLPLGQDHRLTGQEVRQIQDHLLDIYHVQEGRAVPLDSRVRALIESHADDAEGLVNELRTLVRQGVLPSREDARGAPAQPSGDDAV
jgi:hypothetical protein